MPSEKEPTTEEGLPLFGMPDIGDSDPEPEETPETPNLEERLAAIETQRSEETKRYEELVARQQQTIDRLLQGLPAQSAPSPTSAAPTMPDLPDPVERPDDFRKAVADLVRQQAQQFATSTQQAATTQQQIEAVRNRFWQKNPDLSDYPEFVDRAYQTEAQRMQQLGVDPQSALLRDPDGISERVAQAARERMKALGIGAKKDADPSPEPSSKGRTAGVSAGTVPTAPARRAPNGEAQDFVSLLRKQQVESGFF